MTLFHVPAIDDADDTRIQRSLGRQEWKRRFLTAHEKDVLTDARPYRIRGHQLPARGLPVWSHGLEQQQLVTDELRIFDRRDDVAEHARDLHVSPSRPHERRL